VKYLVLVSLVLVPLLVGCRAANQRYERPSDSAFECAVYADPERDTGLLIAVWADGTVLKAIKHESGATHTWRGTADPATLVELDRVLSRSAIEMHDRRLLAVPHTPIRTFYVRRAGKNHFAHWDETIWPGWGTLLNGESFRRFAKDWTEARILMCLLAMDAVDPIELATDTDMVTRVGSNDAQQLLSARRFSPRPDLPPPFPTK
jgi:hypothetical protein